MRIDDESGKTIFSDFAGFTGNKTYIPSKAGVYTAVISACNNRGTIWEGASCQFTVLDKPTDVSVTTDRSIYIIGDTVTITPFAIGEARFTMRIDDESGETVFSDFIGFTGNKTYIPSKAGLYTVHISAANSTGTVWENAHCQFTVLEKPIDVSVITDRSIYVIGDPVIISPVATGTNNFTMRIDDESGETIFKDFDGFTGIKTYATEKAGNFTVHISACNNTGTIREDAVCTFVVLENATPMIQTVVIDEGAVVTQLFCQDSDVNVFCAVYNDDGKMISIESQIITMAQRYTFQFEDISFAYAKVFILDGNLRPLCESKGT